MDRYASLFITAVKVAWSRTKQEFNMITMQDINDYLHGNKLASAAQ